VTKVSLFAVGAIALQHGCVITIGVFSLLGREPHTMVSAMLTIAGIRSTTRRGLRKSGRTSEQQRETSIEQIMNDSINQTLSRHPHQHRTVIPFSVVSSAAQFCATSHSRSSS
jgi:preprotein translocase subunit SecF